MRVLTNRHLRILSLLIATFVAAACSTASSALREITTEFSSRGPATTLFGVAPPPEDRPSVSPGM